MSLGITVCHNPKKVTNDVKLQIFLFAYIISMVYYNLIPDISHRTSLVVYTLGVLQVTMCSSSDVIVISK